MLDRVSPAFFAFAGAPAPTEPTLPRQESLRARHAIMLSYAGKRRRAAQLGLDGPYWKAIHPAAVQRARDLRAGAGFTHLP